MIVGIEGILESRGMDSVVIKSGGWSVQVFVPASTLGKLGKPGDMVRLHTYFHVREDVIALYGFVAVQELELFRHLITVSGFGPRSAMSLLSVCSVGEAVGAIASGDAARLTRVPGIGKKTAERLILELKNKLEKGLKGVAPVVAGGSETSDVIAALNSLGYTLREASEAVGGLTFEPWMKLEDKIKLALRRLARK